MEKIGIYMKKVKFNESQIQYIIKESMEPDYIGTIDDIDGEIPQEDDWRSDEPSQGYVQSTFETIEQQCNACGAIFKNMGDNEFGVIIKDMGTANELVDSLKNMEQSGIIYNTGGNLSMGRVKYRIIKEINENKQVNEAYDMNQGTGAYELYEYFRVLASQGNEEAKAKMEDLIQNHHYEICEQLAWIFRDVYKENGYSDPMINSQCTTYIQRIEGSEGNEMSEELQLLGKRYLRMLNDPNLSFVDLEELGLCVYEEMKKYAEKYRKKLDQNNKKRREARLKQSENQKVNINEEQLKQIVSESVKRVLKEGLFDMFRRGPSAEEMEQQRLHNYYENRIISLMKKAAMSYEVHNGDANYVTMLQTAKEAYDKGVIQEYEFSNWFEKYYYEPRTRLLNQNNWLLRKGEKYPQDYWPGLENIG